MNLECASFLIVPKSMSDVKLPSILTTMSIWPPYRPFDQSMNLSAVPLSVKRSRRSLRARCQMAGKEFGRWRAHWYFSNMWTGLCAWGPRWLVRMRGRNSLMQVFSAYIDWYVIMRRISNCQFSDLFSMQPVHRQVNMIMTNACLSSWLSQT